MTLYFGLKMKIKHKNNQKPIELDIHFKYRCVDCSIDHWLSYNQVRTKNYKIVCDCGAIFQPKKINKVKILYQKKIKKLINPTQQNIESINLELISKCCSVLMNYGFTKLESESLLIKAHQKNPTNDNKLLIKTALSLIGVNND